MCCVVDQSGPPEVSLICCLVWGSTVLWCLLQVVLLETTLQLCLKRLCFFSVDSAAKRIRFVDVCYSVTGCTEKWTRRSCDCSPLYSLLLAETSVESKFLVVAMPPELGNRVFSMAVVQRLYQLQSQDVSIVGQAKRMLLRYPSMYGPFCNVDVCECVTAGASHKSELMTSRRAQKRGCSLFAFV